MECWKCGCEYDEGDDFCPECDAGIEPFGSQELNDAIASKNEKVTCDNSVGNAKGSENANMSWGAWCLVQISSIFRKKPQQIVQLYTNKACDLVVHRATGTKYKRGQRKLFWASRGEAKPKLVEETDEYEFIYFGGPKG